MKIALFTDAYLPDINGVVSSVVILQKQLEKHGHTVYIVTTHPKLLETKIESNIIRLPGVELKKLYGYVMTSPIHRHAAEVIGSWDLDIIHAHTEFGVGIFARLVAKKYKIPLVSTYHTAYEDYTHYINIINSKVVDNVAKKTIASLSKLYVDSSVAVIAPTQKTKDMLVGYGIDSHIFIVPTGLDLKRFSKSSSDQKIIAEVRNQQYQAQAGETLILYVGRIAKEKSIDVIIDAFSFVKAAKEKCRLIIIGDGPDVDSLKKQVVNLDISEYVSFLGKRPLEEIPRYYHSVDAFVSASLTETQGVTFIEALASGLPVFARPDEAIANLIHEEQTGFYFKTPEELAQKLIAFHKSTALKRKELSRNAVDTVQVYDAEKFYQDIMVVYQSAIEIYHRLYTITHIRYRHDCVEITVENDTTVNKILISVDTFAQLELRKEGKITTEILEKLQTEQAIVQAYQKCIRRLTIKDRTRKEMYDWLEKNTELSIENINGIIEKLEKNNYIDDSRFVYSQIMTLKSHLQGRKKIERSLLKRGVAIELISEALAHEDDYDQLNLAIRYAERIQTTIRGKSLKYKKQVMKQKMLQQGYTMDIVDETLSRLSFISEERDELSHLRKQAIKIRNRYQKKYPTTQLRMRTQKYLMTQGYKSDDIKFILNEMEWDYEQNDD